MDFVQRWIEDSPYARTLNVSLADIDGKSARLVLPFEESLTNGDGVMHGGCAASLASLGAQAVARAALGEASGPWHTASLQVAYLAAAKGQGVTAQARLQRSGKEISFVEIEVTGEDGREIAHATAVAHEGVVRGDGVLKSARGLDADAEHGAQQGRAVLARAERIAARTTVAHPDVEVAVRPKLKTTTIVVPIGLVKLKQNAL